MFKKLKDVSIWPAKRYIKTKKYRYTLLPSAIVVSLISLKFPICDFRLFVLTIIICCLYGFVSGMIVMKEKKDADL